MKYDRVTEIPDNYIRAVIKEQQGTISEVAYHASNYITPSRELASSQNLTKEVAGRETVQEEAIIKKCNIYLPAGYDKNDNTKKYDVLYLLHGVGGDRFEWLSGSGEMDGNYVICNILDNLIANGDIEPLIVVFPEGRSTYDWTDRSFTTDGTNILGFYYFDYELRYDLIPFIESEYHTYADVKDCSKEGIAYNRLHRAIGGLSMGGMQSLNLILGGYRCDSVIYTGTAGSWDNGLDIAIPAPGMTDLFTFVGAFSNAPTSSQGKVLGSSVASAGRKLDLLYLTCGDEDGIAYQVGYANSIDGLSEAAGDSLGDYYRVVIKDGVHDFKVWNNGAYNFIRLAFGNIERGDKRYNVDMELNLH